MGRRPVSQGIEQKAKLFLGLFGTNIKRPKDLALHGLLVNTHRPAPKLPAIKNHVVGLSQAAAGVLLHTVFMPRLGRRKRMMNSREPAIFLIKLKHWEVNHPQGSPAGCKEPIAPSKFRLTDANP